MWPWEGFHDSSHGEGRNGVVDRVLKLHSRDFLDQGADQVVRYLPDQRAETVAACRLDRYEPRAEKWEQIGDNGGLTI